MHRLACNILHGDISENNIIIIDVEKTGFVGMLIDLDHAEELSTGSSGKRLFTGTVEFMAYEVLDNIDHTYRHDLESFLYVFIGQCVRRDSSGSYELIACNKLRSMIPQTFRRLLEEFRSDFEGLKSFFWELRDLLFSFRGNSMFTGTPEGPEMLYKPMIEAFDKALDSIKTEGTIA